MKQSHNVSEMLDLFTNLKINNPKLVGTHNLIIRKEL
jgi:hypothetical protein